MSTKYRRCRCSPEDVARVLGNGWLYASWVVGASRMRSVDDEWPAPGSKLHHSVGTWPLVLNDSTEVLEWKPGERMVLRARGWPIGVAQVTIEGQTFCCLNGGPHPGAQRSDSISFQILGEDQAEVDEYWNQLAADGGQEVQCGWLKDRYGISWQIVPEILPRLMGDPDRAKAARVTAAMMKMIKLDVAALEAAAEG